MRYRVTVTIEDEFVDWFEAGEAGEAEDKAKEQLLDFLSKGSTDFILRAKVEEDQ